MRFGVLATIFTVLVVVSAGKKCSSTEECEAGECCTSSTIFAFRKGDCKPLAREGEGCSTEDVSMFGKYPLHCPCETGLTCEPEREHDMGMFGKIKVNERCVSEPASKEPEPEPETDAPVEE